MGGKYLVKIYDRKSLGRKTAIVLGYVGPFKTYRVALKFVGDYLDSNDQRFLLVPRE